MSSLQPLYSRPLLLMSCFPFTGHAATISTLSYAIRFWSKGSKRALFLRHEGYVGAIGAWLKNLSENGGNTPIRRDVPLPRETERRPAAPADELAGELEKVRLEGMGAGEEVEVGVESDDR